FPSASATASADPPGPIPSPRQRLRRCCGGFDSRPPPLRRRTRLARCHLPASGFAAAVAGPMPDRRRGGVGGPAWPDAISPPAASPLLWRVRFPSASATASADPPGPMPSPRQRLRRCSGGFDSRPPPLLRSDDAGDSDGRGITNPPTSDFRLPTSDFRLSFPFASDPDVVSSAMGIEIVRGSDSLTISDEQLQRLAEESAIPVARLVEEPGDHTHAT